MRPSDFAARLTTSFAACCVALALCVAAPAHAAPAGPEKRDGAAFVAAFAEVCIPERLSYEGTLRLAEELGWRRVAEGENAERDRFIALTDSLLAQAFAEDPDLFQGSDMAWFTRVVDGRTLVLAVNRLLTTFLDTLGCQIYEFGAPGPIDPSAVTELLGQPIAYSTDGDDPFYAVDPALLVATVWGPPPGLPRTLDTQLMFIPEDSPQASEIGFSGLMLKFSTSLPAREEPQE